MKGKILVGGESRQMILLLENKRERGEREM